MLLILAVCVRFRITIWLKSGSAYLNSLVGSRLLAALSELEEPTKDPEKSDSTLSRSLTLLDTMVITTDKDSSVPSRIPNQLSSLT